MRKFISIDPGERLVENDGRTYAEWVALAREIDRRGAPQLISGKTLRQLLELIK